MRTRRGSTYWTTTLKGHLKPFQKGDLVTAVTVSESSFIGIVRNVCMKTNKVMVAWGGGSLVQHDPDEIQLSVRQSDVVKSKMASRRSLIAKSEEEAEANPQFVGDPKLHGLDTPRGGGFSIMQNLQEDLREEEEEQREQGTLQPKVANLRSRRDVKAKKEVPEEFEEHKFTKDDNPSKDKKANELRSRRGMYHCGPGRQYRLTRGEQETGERHCPKCKAPMEAHKFIRGNDIYMCGGCGFKVTKDKLLTEMPQPVVEAVPSQEAVVAEEATELRSRRDVAKAQWPLR